MEGDFLWYTITLDSHGRHGGRRRDIVILRNASFDPAPIVKRVIATAGQTVDIDFGAGVVSVDGRPLAAPGKTADTEQRDRGRAGGLG